MTKTTRQRLGSWGEKLTASYLTERGYTLIATNERTPYGEIDLIASQPDGQGSTVTVFIEVKTRSSSSFGLPEQSVGRRKQEHLLNSARYYLQEHPEAGENWRVDVIAIQRGRLENPPLITHFENAFGS
jgi:putative endonuclease